MEVRSKVKLVNSRGLHARPCHAIVTAASSFKSSLRVAYDGQEVDAKSILELLTLSAAQGAELELIAAGDDAQELVHGVSAVIAAGFGETD